MRIIRNVGALGITSIRPVHSGICEKGHRNSGDKGEDWGHNVKFGFRGQSQEILPSPVTGGANVNHRANMC